MDNRGDSVLSSRRTVPPWIDALAVRAAKFPWWMLIVATGLVILFFSFASSNLYRRVLQFVTDNPQITTTRFARVRYVVAAADGTERTVRGTLIAQDGESVTIETQSEVLTSIPKPDVGTITCAEQASNGECPVGQPVTVERVSISGQLVFETTGKYDVITSLGDEVEILKISVVQGSDVRTPPNCAANTEGACSVALQLIPGEQGNTFVDVLLVESSLDAITVQNVPSQVEVIQRANIISEVLNEPDQCALNNLWGCNEGPFLTLQLTFSAFFLAAIIGLVSGLMRISSNPILTNIATVYVEVIRGVPLLVILLFVNFAFKIWFRDQFPSLAPTFAVIIGVVGAVIIGVLIFLNARQKLPFEEVLRPVIVVAIITAILIVVTIYFSVSGNSNLTSIQCAVIGLGIGYGAFLSELFRAGIQSIPKGQMEASRSLGMTYVQAMRYVILPQAFRIVLPPLGNDFIAILKDTSLVAILAIPELTQRARIFAADTLQVFPSYITIGALYLIMTLFLSFLVRTVERRTATNR